MKISIVLAVLLGLLARLVAAKEEDVKLENLTELVDSLDEIENQLEVTTEEEKDLVE